MIGSATTWLHDFEHGASFHGNWPACIEAEQSMPRFRGGKRCPRGCGSIIREQVGSTMRQAVTRHLEDARACLKHPGVKGRRDMAEERWAPRRRKCRRPSWVSEAAAQAYARVVLGDRGRTAYACSAHPTPRYHLRPKERTAKA